MLCCYVHKQHCLQRAFLGTMNNMAFCNAHWLNFKIYDLICKCNNKKMVFTMWVVNSTNIFLNVIKSLGEFFLAFQPHRAFGDAYSFAVDNHDPICKYDNIAWFVQGKLQILQVFLFMLVDVFLSYNQTCRNFKVLSVIFSVLLAMSKAQKFI